MKRKQIIPPNQNILLEVRDSRGIVIVRDTQLYQAFLSDRFASLASHLITFSITIEEKTRDFVGRDFVFDELQEFIKSVSSGYFIIKGKPGIGKTSLIAKMTETYQCVHHFVIGTLGINRVSQFLENVSAQLIARYDLPYSSDILSNTTRDGLFLDSLLHEISRRLSGNEKALILIDALDEVDWRRGGRENILYLPEQLPNGVYVVVTTRDKEDIRLQVNESRIFYLEADSPNNREDVLRYIHDYASHKNMKERLSRWSITIDTFAQALSKKSEGNFMYLRYVLPAIAEGKFVRGTLDELPQGLKGYYESHWQQMLTSNEDLWVNYRQPVIYFLAASKEPVTIRQVAAWAKLPTTRVLAAIRDWREFLEEGTVDQGTEKTYRLYHSSFQDFVANKDAARLLQSHRDIADRLLQELQSMRVDVRNTHNTVKEGLSDINRSMQLIRQEIGDVEYEQLRAIQELVRLGRLDQDEMERTFDSIRRALRVMMRYESLQSEELRKLLAYFTSTMKSDLSFQHKLELTLPLLPFLAYKVELGGEGKQDFDGLKQSLKKQWLALVHEKR